MAFAPGETVGPYRIIDQIGQGGMAAVFKAYHTSLDRYVAIKVLNPAIKDDRNFLSRFQREARIVAKLDHPNIIPIYDFAVHEGTPFLVMRFIEGKPLKTILHGEPIPPAQALMLLRPVLAALDYAHSRGVLHRDIKPSNIIIANDGQIFLADFGLARMVQATVSTASEDALVGTPQYISPEQAKGDPVDARSDIYAFGIVLYEMLTGRIPFSAETPYSIIHDHIYRPVPMPSEINPSISGELEIVLLKALAKDPAARYANIGNFAVALENAIGVVSPEIQSQAQPPRRIFDQVDPKILIGVGTLLVIILLVLSGRFGAPSAIVIPSPSSGQVVALATPVPPTETALPTPPATLVPTVPPTSTPTNVPTPTFTPTPVPVTPTVTPIPTIALLPGMVLVPAGPFWMGASPEDGHAAPNEKPGHLVELSAFAIDQFEVSNADYRKCVTAGVCSLPKGVFSPQSPHLAYGNPAFDDRPVVYVTHGMASQYCTWLGKRLPYESEWEKAARGSADQRIYPWGNVWEGERLNAAFGNPGLVPVTAYTPKGCSPYGVCNIAGNAAEWIADFYSATFYADSIRNLVAPAIIRDPINWDSSSGRFVIRGGSFKSNSFDSRVSKRSERSGEQAVDDVGFRCAQSTPSR